MIISNISSISPDKMLVINDQTIIKKKIRDELVSDENKKLNLYVSPINYRDTLEEIYYTLLINRKTNGTDRKPFNDMYIDHIVSILNNYIIVNRLKYYEFNKIFTNIIKFIFHIRDIRFGFGQRKLFYYLFVLVGEHYHLSIKKIIHLIPYYGSWRDIISIINYAHKKYNKAIKLKKLKRQREKKRLAVKKQIKSIDTYSDDEYVMDDSDDEHYVKPESYKYNLSNNTDILYNLIKHLAEFYVLQLIKDRAIIKRINDGDNSVNSDDISLASKWAPREKTKNQWTARLFAKILFEKSTENTNDMKTKIGTKKIFNIYRRLLSTLNKNIETPEIYMCNREIDKINKQPGYGFYRKHETKLFNKGNIKFEYVPKKTNYLIPLVTNLIRYYWTNTDAVNLSENQYVESEWEVLLRNMPGNNYIPILDLNSTSGIYSWIIIGIGLLFSEKSIQCKNVIYLYQGDHLIKVNFESYETLMRRIEKIKKTLNKLLECNKLIDLDQIDNLNNNCCPFILTSLSRFYKCLSRKMNNIIEWNVMKTAYPNTIETKTIKGISLVKINGYTPLLLEYIRQNSIISNNGKIKDINLMDIAMEYYSSIS